MGTASERPGREGEVGIGARASMLAGTPWEGEHVAAAHSSTLLTIRLIAADEMSPCSVLE